MLILSLILWGMLIGALGQLLLGKAKNGVNWTLALVAGLLGSFVGGLLSSLLANDGLELRPSGLIGSIVGALIITLLWTGLIGRKQAKDKR